VWEPLGRFVSMDRALHEMRGGIESGHGKYMEDLQRNRPITPIPLLCTTKDTDLGKGLERYGSSRRRT
jgi:hypothetical protein